MFNLQEERCPNCDKLLGKINGYAEIKCPRCKTLVTIKPKPIKKSILNAN
ncbi:MAG: Com family DNA-binding transcriptional regulator [Candidatus Paceibacterota bacterium]|jgi:phage FluMu protein Com